jgi:hypothetical protein
VIPFLVYVSILWVYLAMAHHSLLFVVDGHLCYLGSSVETLIKRLDAEDQCSRGLWDIGGQSCPFTACRLSLTTALVQGSQVGGSLHSFFRNFWDGTPEEHSRLMQKARVIGFDLESQVWWRFLPLHCPPVSLVQAVNPGLSSESQRNVMAATPAHR